MAGYTALHDSAAWLDISSRGRIRASGEDRQGLLHAISSNAVEGLEPGQGVHAFFLHAQGRIQSDSRIFVAEDHVLNDCEPQARQALIDHINSYIIMDDVQLEDAAETTAAIALEGPRADEIAGRALGEVLPSSEPYAHRESAGMRILRASISGQPGLWLICSPGQKDELLKKLQTAGAEAGSEQDFRVVRVENRRPRFGEDYSSANIPHETTLLNAVSFSKGCYLGQEIVERVRARGQVNKLLVSLEFETQQPPEAGTPVDHVGVDLAAVDHALKEAGRLTSPIFSPARGKVLAFAILRREAAAEGGQVTAGGVLGRVHALA
jgi:folate-binding protein YgfZ